MLPKKFRESLFEKASVKTMRYVNAVPVRTSTGLVRRVYDMIAEDFFVNGSLSSHSQVPELFAGTWVGGRELALVSDQLDRTTKEAMGATLSYINDCPYCADMLVSLVHGGGKHQEAFRIFEQTEETIEDPVLRARLEWVRQVGTGSPDLGSAVPFTTEQLPEAIGTLFAFHYINRFSHVAMDGSPIGDSFKNTLLRLFGYELSETTERPIEPGRALALLPAAPLPSDMDWARPNPRIADALSRWVAAVDREASEAVSPEVQDCVRQSLDAWTGERMPMSRAWVEDEIEPLSGDDYHIAKLILIVAKASYQVDDSVVEAVLGKDRDEKQLIRVLAFAAQSAARRLTAHLAEVMTAADHENESDPRHRTLLVELLET